jgi:tetratricopeptide (TPR) repeat protein
LQHSKFQLPKLHDWKCRFHRRELHGILPQRFLHHWSLIASNHPTNGEKNATIPAHSNFITSRLRFVCLILFIAFSTTPIQAQAVFPQQEPADPSTATDLPDNLALKKAVLEAEALYTQEKYNEATTAYEKLLEKHKEAWIYYRLSTLYQNKIQKTLVDDAAKDPTAFNQLHYQTVTMAEKAVELQPKNHSYLLHLASLYSNTLPHKSANLYQQVITLQPRSSSLYVMAAEHAAKQIRFLPTTNASIKTPTTTSPFTDTLLSIAQQYKKQFGINAAYVEMTLYAYNRMPGKEAHKDSLMSQWNAIRFQHVTAVPTEKNPSTTQNSTDQPSPTKQALPPISQKIHQSELLFRCARLYHQSHSPDQQQKVLEEFNRLEEDYPYLDWSISKNYVEKSLQNPSAEFPLTWPNPSQLLTVNPASALIIWQNIEYLSLHLNATLVHYQPFLQSLQALEKQQSVNPQNYKQLVIIIEHLLKTFNSNTESAKLIPHLNQYKKLEDFK